MHDATQFTKFTQGRAWLPFLVAATLGASGCARSTQLRSRTSSAWSCAAERSASERCAHGAPQREPLAIPYPPGRWRRATAEQLASSMVWAGQIVVAHRDAAPGGAAFHDPSWAPRAENPSRSRAEAFVIAELLAERARLEPSEFAELARRYSDDVPTRGAGGALGGRSALELVQWPEILDALAALGPGEVSRVVESEFGFHVLMREAPPQERHVSGARIVIGYDTAPRLHSPLARWPIPRRSRAAALELAEVLYQQLERDPEAFSRLVEVHSDHRDARRGGDFGEWSTHEATPLFQERDVLEQLAPGAVAPPIDSPLGVQIIMRTADTERQTYSMAVLGQSFDPLMPEELPGSLGGAWRDLVAIASEVRGEAAAFAEWRALHCCQGIVTWVRGRGEPSIEMLLDELAVGEIASEPVVLDGARLALVQRLEPRPVLAAPVSLDLPRPSAPEVEGGGEGLRRLMVWAP